MSELRGMTKRGLLASEFYPFGAQSGDHLWKSAYTQTTQNTCTVSRPVFLIQLTFEPHEFKLRGSTYTWIFFSKYSTAL